MADIDLDIPDLRTLKQILKKYKVNTKGWGKHKHTKSVEYLFGEIEHHDCVLVDRKGKLLRKACRAQAYIFHTNKKQKLHLIERQVFENGYKTRRNRDVSVSEKYRCSQGETALEGMLRGIREELGIDVAEPLQLKRIRSKFTYSKSSRSYPTLRSESDITYYLWKMPRRYWKEEYVEKSDHKTTIFSWVPLKTSIRKILVK